MTTSRPSTSRARLRRTLCAAAAALLVWAIVAPVVEAFHDHADDRCCRNGVCCCRPQEDPPGPCIRTVCRCAGHDVDPAGAPLVRQIAPPAVFRLPAPPAARELVPPAASAPEAGFAPPPYHPPRLASSRHG